MSLGQFGGQSRHPALAYLQPLDQPALPSSPKYLPSSQLQRWGQNLESCKSILEKAGKQNEPRREAAISHTGPAWHGHQLSPPSSLPDRPSLQVVFLIKGDASYWVPAGPFKEHSDVIVADYY